MIVLDTTVLVYALGSEHPAREPSRRVIEAVGEGRLEATTTGEVIQEFVHVYERRRTRADAAAHGRSYAALLAPLISPGEADLEAGLDLYERHSRLGAFDAILAAAAIARGAQALVSVDAAFRKVPGLRHVDPRTPRLAELFP